MKKFTALILTIVFLSFCYTGAWAKENEPSIVMAINEKKFIVDSAEIDATAPVLVLNKTYVDLYALAPYIGVDLQWVDESGGLFRASTKNTTCDFTIISKWVELTSFKHKCFVKDSKVFVSLRELVEMVGYNIKYDSGIITIGKQVDYDKSVYGEMDLTSLDDYVCKTYPALAEYVVYPYQEYGYENMLEDVEKLKQMYPDLIKTSSIGKSVEDRDLLLIEFGRGQNKIFVCGAHHAREYITTTYLMYAIDRYAYAYRNGSMWGRYNPKGILDNVTFCIVPMVNPDGVNLVQNGLYSTKDPDKIASMEIYESPQYGYLAWKANMNGVDLNWNYDKDWSKKKNRNPRGSAGFTGDAPRREPETIAVSEYVDNNFFDAYISYHTQGEVFYWADNQEDPLYFDMLIEKDTGFSGYLDDGTGQGGSFFDYVYRKFNKPTLTVELCPYIGNYPYPDKDFDTVWEPTKNVLLIMGNEVIYKASQKND